MMSAFSQDLYSGTVSLNVLRLGLQVNAEQVLTPKFGLMLQAHYRWQGTKEYGWTPTPGVVIHARHYLGKSSAPAHVREGFMLSVFGGYEWFGKTYDTFRSADRVSPHMRLGLMIGQRRMSVKNDRLFFEFHVGLVYNRPLTQWPGWIVSLPPYTFTRLFHWGTQRGTAMNLIYPVLVLNIARPIRKIK